MLPWQREWLGANCIFVNLDHRLYQPDKVVAPIFQPIPRVPINIEEMEEGSDDRMEGPSRIVDKGKGRAVIHSQTVYMEDL